MKHQNILYSSHKRKPKGEHKMNIKKLLGIEKEYLSFDEYKTRIQTYELFGFQQSARNTFLRGLKK